MPIMSFSIPDQVLKLLDGRKQQTTRLNRKRPLKIGDTLYCYYKPRMKQSCINCINYSDEDLGCISYVGCSYWDNYFGEAEIIQLRSFSLYKYSMEEWSDADGFDNIDRAMDWLEKTHPEWEIHMDDFMVITFKSKWLL
jgi:hypothetical protein